ncbi:ABC transporter ATP-binding protein [Haloarchaeobius sp. HRN-SO-5]|uniref:ABC transporter ATP-binding protein n=1 Tax=Haloarchaeobius sp. HRN-SO-5 TaxID=3446118 RepID=UPI003EBB4145
MSKQVISQPQSTAQTEPMISVRNLKTYYPGGGLIDDQPVKAVDGVSFDIEKGETLGLVGESGCGKSTLGRTLVQLEDATSGVSRFQKPDVVEEMANTFTRRTVDLREVYADNDTVDLVTKLFADGVQPKAVAPDQGYEDVGPSDIDAVDFVAQTRVDVPHLVDQGFGPQLGLFDESDFVFLEEGRIENGVYSVERGFIDVTAAPPRALKKLRGKQLGIVFQDPESSLNDRMTVGEIVREPLDVHGWKTPQERRQRVRDLLETVGLRPEHYFRYPHQFSGGQRQRIGIARSLALEPDFLVLDEPVSALDVSVQAKILNLLEDLQNEFGLTYLFIAHDLSVVRHICDRVAVMYLGNIMEIGPTEGLFEYPGNPYTYSLLSAIPEPDPTANKDRITLRGTPPSPRDPPVGCPFSTRCPVKIRPDEYQYVEDEVWQRIEVFREVVRERSRADRSLTDRARELLGRSTRFSDVTEITDELFGDVNVPNEVAEDLREAASYIEQGHDNKARQYLFEQFGSVCDTSKPKHYVVSDDGRTSFCHRHVDGYEDPSREFENLKQ